MKTLIGLAGVAVALLVSAVAARTARYGEAQVAVDEVPGVAVPASAAERLAGSLRIRTISHEDPDSVDPAAFDALHNYLETAFPRVHAQLRREVVGEHSLLYTWSGTDPALKPIVLVAHMDVVPVEPGTEWQQEPFGGRIADGFIWGRGAIDNKSAVVGILEAVEMLLADGFRPTRTLLLAYGHDEEIGGSRGARAIAALLKQRDVKAELVLDEGGVIGDGVLPGVSTPVALVGIAEKGFATVELSTLGTGGHSSLPPPQSTVGIVAAAITRLEAEPMPARLEGATAQLFERVAPRLPLLQRVAFANSWVTEPMLVRRLASSPNTNAMIRTTTAATVFQAGTKDNVLPRIARAAVNFRVLPGDSVAGVLDYVRRTVSDPRIEIRLAGSFSAEPSAISRTDSEGFRMLERTIRSVAGDVLVAPYLVVVVTDARYYAELADNTFRFLPLRLTPADLARMHGTDERIAVAEYYRAIQLYRQLILNGTS